METDIATVNNNAMIVQPAPTMGGMMVQTREMMEIRAKVASAKQFPRDIALVRSDILASCDSPALAEISQYLYSKGGAEITGPSIRLAEELANAYQNMDKGWRELDRKPSIGNVPGESTIEAFAWDMQRNVSAKRIFTVRHWRDTKKGGYALKDERDIYELCANQAARRYRACILELIPKFIVDEAIERCDQTLKKSNGALDKEIPKMLAAFEKIGVTKEMIEKRVQRKVETIDQTQFGSLRKVYGSLVDGMSKIDQWFEVGGAPIQESTQAAPDAEAPPPTQSLAKKTATKPQENAKKEATPAQSKTAPAIKNSAPTAEEIKAKKEAAANPPPPPPLTIAKEPDFGMTEDPIEELPPFMSVWNDIGIVAKQKWPDAPAARAADFCRQVTGKGPQELKTANDVKAVLKVYAEILKEVQK